MRLSVHQTSIPEVLIVEHDAFQDDRGFLLEAYHAPEFAKHADLGLPSSFVQLNHSRSRKGVTRGLHFQWEPPMGKYMRVARGAAFLVAVDIRPGSPTLGQHVAIVADDENHLALWAPACFARGFATLSDVVDIEYLVTGNYDGSAESGIAWNDPDVGIEWPVAEPITSERDSQAQSLSEWLARPEAQHFRYQDWSQTRP
jgi:dTDP-4-dehydrorhamnose 3,5-epimerase